MIQILLLLPATQQEHSKVVFKKRPSLSLSSSDWTIQGLPSTLCSALYRDSAPLLGLGFRPELFLVSTGRIQASSRKDRGAWPPTLPHLLPKLSPSLSVKGQDLLTAHPQAGGARMEAGRIEGGQLKKKKRIRWAVQGHPAPPSDSGPYCLIPASTKVTVQSLRFFSSTGPRDSPAWYSLKGGTFKI